MCGYCHGMIRVRAAEASYTVYEFESSNLTPPPPPPLPFSFPLPTIALQVMAGLVDPVAPVLALLGDIGLGKEVRDGCHDV